MQNPEATSNRRLFGPCVVLMKRLGRKLTHWYVAPQIQALRSQLADLERCMIDRLRREDMLVRQWQTSIRHQNDRSAEITRELDSKLDEQRSLGEASLDQINKRLSNLETRFDALNESINELDKRARDRSALLSKEMARLHQRLADLDVERIGLRKMLHAQTSSICPAPFLEAS